MDVPSYPKTILSYRKVQHSRILQDSYTTEPPLAATSLQRQSPLKRIPNSQNNLSKTSRMVMKFDLYGALMIDRGNRVLIVFHLYC